MFYRRGVLPPKSPPEREYSQNPEPPRRIRCFGELSPGWIEDYVGNMRGRVAAFQPKMEPADYANIPFLSDVATSTEAPYPGAFLAAEGNKEEQTNNPWARTVEALRYTT